MNVFVLCSGQCGSTTFSRACKHITNYTRGHESQCNRLGEAHFAYPDRHIEIDNRLGWFTGRLHEAYGDKAFYVHLARKREDTAKSLNRTWCNDISIMRHYADDMLMSKARSIEVCFDFVDTINANIRVFLRDKPHHMTFMLEDAKTHFQHFWNAIGAEGDLDAALAEWDVLYNRASAPVPDRLRWLRKLVRVFKYLPHYIKYS
ncbi:MAG: hypothetical protein O3C57_03470 [Verrucomicrobia bacterium]|nr:hypothetical protein [Verrucomicrobiota bacterium]